MARKDESRYEVLVKADGKWRKATRVKRLDAAVATFNSLGRNGFIEGATEAVLLMVIVIERKPL